MQAGRQPTSAVTVKVVATLVLTVFTAAFSLNIGAKGVVASMADRYDFGNLSPIEFEGLCIDLLAAETAPVGQ